MTTLSFIYSRDFSRKEVSEDELTDEQRELADTYLPNLEDLSSVNKILEDASSKAIILVWVLYINCIILRHDWCSCCMQIMLLKNSLQISSL